MRSYTKGTFESIAWPRFFLTTGSNICTTFDFPNLCTRRGKFYFMGCTFSSAQIWASLQARVFPQSEMLRFYFFCMWHYFYLKFTIFASSGTDLGILATTSHVTQYIRENKNPWFSLLSVAFWLGVSPCDLDQSNREEWRERKKGL